MFQQENNTSFNNEVENYEKTFDLIYKKYHKLLWMEAAACLHNPSQSKDIVQEVFTTLWEKKSLANVTETSLKSYLLQCVRHKCFRINHKETSLKHKAKDYLETRETFFINEDQFVCKELSGKLSLALESLPEKAGRAFEMVYIEQVEQKKAAEKLQISMQTLRNQIHGSLKKLREKLIGIR